LERGGRRWIVAAGRAAWWSTSRAGGECAAGCKAEASARAKVPPRRDVAAGLTLAIASDDTALLLRGRVLIARTGGPRMRDCLGVGIGR